MFTEPVEFSDAMLDGYKEEPTEWQPITRATFKATFTASLAHHLGCPELLSDSRMDLAKAILRTGCKSFRADMRIQGLKEATLQFHGDELKAFQVVMREDQQPELQFMAVCVNKGPQFNAWMSTVGKNQGVLRVTPLQGSLEADEETEDDAGRIWPQREPDGSYPSRLAERREYRTAKLEADLYALEVEQGVWLCGWWYKHGSAVGNLLIGHDINGEVGMAVELIGLDSMAQAFEFAAQNLQNRFETFAKTANKTEQKQIEHLVDWLQQQINAAATTDELSEVLAEALEE